MKQLLSILLVTFLSIHTVFAQVPQGIPYQAAARSANGQPLVNTNVLVRFSIIDSSATGNLIFQETHAVSTNSLGLFNVNIGMGNPTQGTFTGINWGQNFKFLKVEIDTSALGANYVDMGTQQMMSVPYAMFSGASNSVQSNGGSNSSTLIYTTNGF